MKCNKCDEKLPGIPGKSLKFCPNCAAPISQMVSSSDNVIKAIVAQYGDNLFLDPSNLRSLAADRLRGNDPDMLKRIDQAISEKVPQELYELRSGDEHKRLLGMKVILSSLMDSYSEKRSYEIINIFAEALGFKKLVLNSLPTPLTLSVKVTIIHPINCSNIDIGLPNNIVLRDVFEHLVNTSFLDVGQLYTGMRIPARSGHRFR